MRGTSTQGNIHSGHVHHHGQELGPSAVGNPFIGSSKDGGGRKLASLSEFGRRNQSKDQDRNVCLVFARSSLGVLCLQSNLVGNTRWERGKEGSQRWRASERKAKKIASCLVSRAGQMRPDRASIPRPTLSVPDWSTGDTSGRGRGSAVDRLRFQEGGLSHPPLLLLETRRASESYKNGGPGKTPADARGAENCSSGVAVAMLVPPGHGFCLSVTSSERSQTSRSCRSAESKDQAGIRQVRDCGCRLAHIPTHRGDDAGGHGRTSAHDPRLSTPQQFERYQQIPSSYVADKAIGPGKIGRRALTHRAASDKQVQFSPMSLHVHSPAPYSLVGPRLGPRFLGDIRKLLKEMVGTRRLELLTSTVSK